MEIYWTVLDSPDKGVQAQSAMNVHLIVSRTNEKKPVIHIWVKKVKHLLSKKHYSYNVDHALGPRMPVQQCIYRCNSITVLIFLNILLILIATMWMVSIHNKDWLNNQPKACTGNHNQDWLNNQPPKASAGQFVVSQAPIKSWQSKRSSKKLIMRGSWNTAQKSLAYHGSALTA